MAIVRNGDGNTGSSMGSLSQVDSVENVADLKVYNGPYDTVQIQGYYTPGDGGGQTVYWDSTSTDTANDGTIFQKTGVTTGRWKSVDTSAINIKQFGAKIDGVTDDTARILAANINDDLYATDGILLVSNLVFTSRVNLILSAGCTIKLADSSNNPVVSLTVAGSSVKGGKIDGNSSGQASQADGVNVSADDCIVRDVDIVDTFSYAISATDVNNIKIIDNNIIDSGWTSIFVKANTADFNKVLVRGNTIDRSAIGIGLTGGGVKVIGDSSVNHLNGVRVLGNDVILPAFPTSIAAICIEVFGLAPNSTVQGNVTNGGEMGISIDSSDHSTVNGNTVQNGDTYGIEIAGSSHCTITGNTIDTVAGRGIATTNATPTNNTISNNTITGCDTNSIYLTTGSDDCVVSGNTVLNKTGINFVMCHIVSSTGCSVTGNTFDGNNTTSQVIRLDKSDNCSITGNTAKNKTSGFVQIFDASANTYSEISLTGNTTVNCGAPMALGSLAIAGANIKMKGHVDSTINYDYIDFSKNIKAVNRAGTPEAAISAGIGSICYRDDGAAGTSFYVKESGTGNTGWVGK